MKSVYRRFWPLLVPITLAAGYGVFELGRLTTAGSPVSGSEVLISLAAEPRVQFFVVIPSWLVACCARIWRAQGPHTLLRYGSWRRTLVKPWLALLRWFLISAAIVTTLWLGMVSVGSGQPLDVPFRALGLVGGEILWVCLALSNMYFALVIVAIRSSSLVPLGILAATIWLWVGLSNLGLFAGTLLDLSSYFSVQLAVTRPQIAIVVTTVFALTSSTAWLVASNRDQDSSVGRAKLSYTSVAIVLAFILAVAGSALSNSHQSSGAGAVFLGIGGSVSQYILGMLILLLVVSASTMQFSESWHQRLPLLLVRFGSVEKLVLRTFATQALTVTLQIVGLLTAVLAVRLLTENPSSWAKELAEALSALPRLILACFLFTAIGVWAVIQFSSEISGAASLAVVMGVGFTPANLFPGFPITGWSTLWTGAEANTASASLAISVAIALCVLVVVSRTRKGARSYVSH